MSSKNDLSSKFQTVVHRAEDVNDLKCALNGALLEITSAFQSQYSIVAATQRSQGHHKKIIWKQESAELIKVLYLKSTELQFFLCN